MMPDNIDDVIYLSSVDSTNTYLLNYPQKYNKLVCIAEQQTQGRGRQGKQWQSPPGKNIYLSYGYTIATKPEPSLAAWQGLSCAVGVKVCSVLQSLDVNPGLKWPNDILLADKKLAGILIESRDNRLVIGLGMNINLSSGELPELEQAYTSLAIETGRQYDREPIILALIEAIDRAVMTIQADGFTAFQQKWNSLDSFSHCTLELTSPDETFIGTNLGVNARGELLVQQDQQVRVINSANYSLRRI